MPRTCATMALHHALARASETYQTNRRQIEAFTTALRRAGAGHRAQVARIPVVVHVLHHAPAENIADAQVRSQIDGLNHDYRRLNTDLAKVPPPLGPLAADALIEFGLAAKDPRGHATSGITRTRTPLPVFQPDGDVDLEGQILALDARIKTVAGGGAAAWPCDRYLNIWVCNMGCSPLGYAQFPGGPSETDGVVVDVTCFGTGGAAGRPFDMGRTATHEIGHWLNLLHARGDDDPGGSGVDSVGDGNFMDLAEDAAMQMFTVGQVERMNAALYGPRASVVASDALTPSHRIPQVHLPELTAFLAGAPAPAREDEPVQPVFDGVRWI